jgi:hypothetical protein
MAALGVMQVIVTQTIITHTAQGSAAEAPGQPVHFTVGRPTFRSWLGIPMPWEASIDRKTGKSRDISLYYISNTEFPITFHDAFLIDLQEFREKVGGCLPMDLSDGFESQPTPKLSPEDELRVAIRHAGRNIGSSRYGRSRLPGEGPHRLKGAPGTELRIYYSELVAETIDVHLASYEAFENFRSELHSNLNGMKLESDPDSTPRTGDIVLTQIEEALPSPPPAEFQEFEPADDPFDSDIEDRPFRPYL